jgi:hypothetical protein
MRQRSRPVGRVAVVGVATDGGGGEDPENTHYIRDGASGDGSDWANALDALPATLQRGHTYYIADGTYAEYTFDDAISSTSVITVKKATASDHGTSTGWSSGYGDGQAVFNGRLIFNTDYITVDGVTRNESDWADGDAYGIRADGLRSSRFENTLDRGARHITAKYLNLGGPEGTTYTGAEVDDTVYLGGFGAYCSDWWVYRCYHHNVKSYTFVQAAGVQNVGGSYGLLIEYNHFRNGFGKEAIRGGNDITEDTIIRWNQFYNASGHTGLPGEGSTAEIAIWDSACDNVEIYGNWFYRTRDDNSGGTIVVGGNGTSWEGPGANNCLVYNNTIAGVAGSTVGGNIQVLGGTGNVVRNNLWYDTNGSSVVTAGTVTTSNNVDAGADPFVDYATGDLHLSGATTAGFSLSSPYDVDMDGVTRSTPDVGAYEYT